MLVFDLGGGTFDVSLLDVGDGVVEVRATSGDGHLGGDDFDKRIVDWLADEFKRDQGIDLRDGPAGAAAALRGGRAREGRAVVDHDTTQINLPFITADASGPEAPEHVADAREVRAADARPDRALPRARSSRRCPTPS